jgi:hypothetical protein
MDVNRNLLQGALQIMERATISTSEAEGYLVIRQHLIELIQSEPPAPELQVVNEGHDLQSK